MKQNKPDLVNLGDCGIIPLSPLQSVNAPEFFYSAAQSHIMVWSKKGHAVWRFFRGLWQRIEAVTTMQCGPFSFHCGARRGEAWLGWARLGAAWHGVARQGIARLGEARVSLSNHSFGSHCKARPGLAWRGGAGHCWAGQGAAWRGLARQGKARQGKK